MKKILGFLLLGVVLVAPAMAADTGAGTGTLSVIEFRSLPENHGMPQRVIQNRYSEYRSGRYVPASTLDVSRVR